MNDSYATEGLSDRRAVPLISNKKSPQIVGLRSRMRLRNSLSFKHNANTLNILVHLQLLCAQRGNELSLMTSQRLSIQSVAQSATVWLGEF